MRFYKVIFHLGLLLTLSGGVSAQADLTGPTLAKSNPISTTSNIPFRSEQQSLADQSLSAFFITVVLLGATVAALYYLRNHLRKKEGPAFFRPSSIKLKERVRLNPQLTIYVVTYRNKEIVLAQSGSSITAVSELIIDPTSSLQSQN